MKVSNMNNINIAREWTRVMLIGKIPSIFFTLTSQISQLVTVDVVFRNSVQSNNQLKLNNNSDTLLMHFKLLECEILKLFSTNVIKFHCWMCVESFFWEFYCRFVIISLLANRMRTQLTDNGWFWWLDFAVFAPIYFPFYSHN